MVYTFLFQKLIEKDRHRCIELEIHPIFLIPDTNCFIDHFSSLKQLIQLKKYTVVVPLIGNTLYCSVGHFLKDLSFKTF